MFSLEINFLEITCQNRKLGKILKGELHKYFGNTLSCETVASRININKHKHRWRHIPSCKTQRWTYV